MENSITKDTLVIIPEKYKGYFFTLKPETPYSIKGEKAEFLTSSTPILIPLDELKLAPLPYYNYHKDSTKCIIIDSRLKNGKKLYKSAYQALQNKGKGCDGGYINCFFNKDLTKVIIKGKNGQLTISLEDLNEI